MLRVGLLLRLPFVRQLLRLGDLRRAHLGGNLVQASRLQGLRLWYGHMTLRCRHMPEADGGDIRFASRHAFID